MLVAKRRACLFLQMLMLTCLFSSVRGEGKAYPYRWVFVWKPLSDATQVEEIREIAKTASEHGLNGMVLSTVLDRLDLESPYTFKYLKGIENICKEYGLDLIPQVMSVGYNAFMLAHDKNLAEGLPVKDALFIAGAEEAGHVPDPAVSIVNGGFEKYKGDKAEGYSFPYEDQQVAFIDKEIFKEGNVSLRFENFGKQRDDGRLIQEVTLKPYRLYRISFWVKTENLDPSNPFGSGRFRVEALGDGQRRLSYFDPQVPGTSGWQKVNVGFNSKTYSRAVISLGVWGGETGRFWLDDVNIEEVGLINILRRPGTPLVVINEKSGVVYEEGRDFARVEDHVLNFMFDHEGPDIELLPGSRIKEGMRLRVSYYHGVAIYQGQTPVCMSEPAVYEIWRRQARLFNEVIDTDMYLLGTDELRTAATCEACKKRNMTAAQILGDCVTRQAAMIREVNPKSKLFIWSDMFDPHHNAGEREGNYYYLVDEDFNGAWNYIPKDIAMVCWYHGRRDKSLAHFSSQGFKTIGAAYCDSDIQIAKDWLESMKNISGASGFMYTTWLHKYDLLGKFGDLVSKATLNP